MTETVFRLKRHLTSFQIMKMCIRDRQTVRCSYIKISAQPRTLNAQQDTLLRKYDIRYVAHRTREGKSLSLRWDGVR